MELEERWHGLREDLPLGALLAPQSSCVLLPPLCPSTFTYQSW